MDRIITGIIINRDPLINFLIVYLKGSKLQKYACQTQKATTYTFEEEFLLNFSVNLCVFSV